MLKPGRDSHPTWQLTDYSHGRYPTHPPPLNNNITTEASNNTQEIDKVSDNSRYIRKQLMNVQVPDATNRTIFVSRTKTQGYHFLPQVSDPKGKEKGKRFCPVSLNSLARSRSKRSRKIQRMDGCMHERNNLNICVVNPIEHVEKCR